VSPGTATAVGSALARNHGSDLLPLRLPFAHKSAVSFVTSPTFRKVFTGLAQASCPPRFERSFCPAFRRLSFGRSSFRRPPESLAPCWRTVATVYPLGNCDSPGLETRPDYLTRLGTVSNRSWPLSSFFRVTDSARTPSEELVNSASVPEPCDPVLRGGESTSLTQPFPSHLGLSLRRLATFFRPPPAISVLSMNC